MMRRAIRDLRQPYMSGERNAIKKRKQHVERQFMG